MSGACSELFRGFSTSRTILFQTSARKGVEQSEFNSFWCHVSRVHLDNWYGTTQWHSGVNSGGDYFPISTRGFVVVDCSVGCN